MIKRVIEISSRPAHLSIRHGQILITYKDEPKEDKTVPIEDVGLVCVDQVQTTYTHRFLAALSENSIALVVCSLSHLPVSILLPHTGHSQIQQRVEGQIALTRSRVKRLWKEVVQEKILMQAECLPADAPERKRLEVIARDVKSGDISNGEGQAAKVYWRTMGRLVNAFESRNANGEDPVNSFLNYGYTVLRAAVAREVVLAGLCPVLGLHHRGRANAFALADDLMEPYRPWVDRTAFALHANGSQEIDTEVKAGLIGALFETVQFVDTKSPLWMGIRQTVKSFASIVDGEGEEINYPSPTPAWS